MPMANQFDELASTTLRKFASTVLTQQVWTADPLTATLFEKGRVAIDGGERIGIPLLTAANDTVSSFRTYDLLDNTPQTGIATAEYDYSSYAVSVVLDNETMRKNSGPEAKTSILKGKLIQAQESLTDKLTVDAYGDGTGNAGKDILGLRAIVSNTGTLAGINRATHTFWQAKANTDAAAMSTAWMGAMVNDIRGSSSASADRTKAGVVDLILMAPDLYQSFEALVEPHLRINGNTLGELGWDTLRYKGAEVAFSSRVPAGTVYFISTKYLTVYSHRDANFVTSDFITPVDQDAKVAHIFWMGQLVTDCPRRMGVATNKTA